MPLLSLSQDYHRQTCHLLTHLYSSLLSSSFIPLAHRIIIFIVTSHLYHYQLVTIFNPLIFINNRHQYCQAINNLCEYAQDCVLLLSTPRKKENNAPIFALSFCSEIKNFKLSAQNFCPTLSFVFCHRTETT